MQPGSPGIKVTPGRDLFDFVPLRHSASYREQLLRALDGGETVVFDVEGPGFEFDAPDVSTPWRRWTRVRITPLAVGGDIRGPIALTQDVDRESRSSAARTASVRTLDHVGEGMLAVDLITGAVLSATRRCALVWTCPPTNCATPRPPGCRLRLKGPLASAGGPARRAHGGSRGAGPGHPA